MKTFGTYAKELRLQKEITLREFCRKTDQDPSNWSKIERNLIQPPQSKTVIEEIAKVLGYGSDKEVIATLIDLSAIAHIPDELISEKEILEKLPVFFRTVRGDPPTEQELQELINLLRER